MKSYVVIERSDVRRAMRLIGRLQAHEESVIDSHSPPKGDLLNERVVADAKAKNRECEDLVRRLEVALLEAQ